MGIEFFSSEMFQRFAAERPIAVMTHMVVSHLLDDSVLDRVFDEHASRQYQRTLTFSNTVRLVASVVMGKSPSVNAAWNKMQAELGVSLAATYGKLERIEPGLSQALVRTSCARSLEVRQALGGRPPHLIAGYDTRILDGNHLEGTERRLKETRDQTAAPLPGKTLVVLDPRYDVIRDCFPIEDGHAQERSAVGRVLETVERGQLWIADRNFCTLNWMWGVVERGAAYLVRQHAKLIGHGAGLLKKVGTTETGTVFEQSFELPAGGNSTDGESMTIRRIVLRLNQPTRDGDAELALLTNVPADRASAIELATAYRARWRIETAFQHLKQSLNSEINTLCYPRAALFCFATALVAYNALSIVKAAMAASQGRNEAEMMSHYQMAIEIAATTDGLLIAIPQEEWQCLKSLTSAEFAEALKGVADQADLNRYRKSVRGPKKTKPPKKHRKNAVHVSTYKILQKRREKTC